MPVTKLRLTQRSMRRIILDICVCVKKKNKQIREQTGACDVLNRIFNLTQNWVEHAPKFQDHRWLKSSVKKPKNINDNKGKPPTRLTYDLKRITSNQNLITQDCSKDFCERNSSLMMMLISIHYDNTDYYAVGMIPLNKKSNKNMKKTNSQSSLLFPKKQGYTIFFTCYIIFVFYQRSFIIYLLSSIHKT